MPKPYRIAELDESIRKARTAHEATMMQEVRKLGVPVPTIQHVDLETSTLIMDYVKGSSLKEELNKLQMPTRKSRCKLLGRLLAQMHQGGIFHGDMTISNVLSENGRLYLIDFGLGDFTHEIEDKGVDLLLLNRVLKSTHYQDHVPLFKAFLEGYSSVVGKKQGKEAFLKMKEIERRGRYFERG
jgi:Kae1-associated kinase Bud32